MRKQRLYSEDAERRNTRFFNNGYRNSGVIVCGDDYHGNSLQLKKNRPGLPISGSYLEEA